MRVPHLKLGPASRSCSISRLVLVTCNDTIAAGAKVKCVCVCACAVVRVRVCASLRFFVSTKVSRTRRLQVQDPVLASFLRRRCVSEPKRLCRMISDATTHREQSDRLACMRCSVAGLEGHQRRGSATRKFHPAPWSSPVELARPLTNDATMSAPGPKEAIDAMSSPPQQKCNATKQELREDGLKSSDVCPACKDCGVDVKVAFHRDAAAPSPQAASSIQGAG